MMTSMDTNDNAIYKISWADGRDEYADTIQDARRHVEGQRTGDAQTNAIEKWEQPLRKAVYITKIDAPAA